MSTQTRKKITDFIDEAVPNSNSKTITLRRIPGTDLHLQISARGSKSFHFRYAVNGRVRGMGLGSIRKVTFDEACRQVRRYQVMIEDGLDPIDERNKAKTPSRKKTGATKTKVPTFIECARKVIENIKVTSKNAKHIEQWENSLRRDAYPILGDMPVSDIGVADILRVLQPIWNTKNETASRLRGRIEKILGWAAVHGYRSSDNPARWTRYLSEVLPKRSAVRKIEHHPALPYQQLPAFFLQLRADTTVASILLQFVILTASRTTEARAVEWSEIDWGNNIWTIPATRMKAGREHRVPLSPPTLKILDNLRQFNEMLTAPSRYVFPGMRKGTHPSEAIMLALLKRMNRRDIVPHGFRSTFRDYVAEMTNHQREVAEAALAHVVGDKTEAAYQRGDYLQKRRALMLEWADYCTSASD